MPGWSWLLLASFLIPLIEFMAGLYGSVYSLLFYRQDPSLFSHLIIQITTVGREPELVQRTIDTINSYKLTMPHEIWVVVEPEMFIDYTGCAEVFVTPADFECKPVDKARALEYSRRIRVERGLNRADVKLLLVDDDTLPSKRYIEKAFAGAYDICQGTTVPNRWYAVGGWRHFLLSHLDDPRPRNCIIWCSTTQGVLGKPLYVHGEGLTMTGHCEDVVTWDWPIVGSDDLVFGTNAAHMGMRWGYFNAAIQLVSPWSFKEHLNQRWRWTWGNLDSIMDRRVMPRVSAAFKLGKYLLGYGSTVFSFTSVTLILTGVVHVSPAVVVLFATSLGLWVLSYGIPGWLCAGGQPNRELRPVWWRYWTFRLVQFVAAMLLTPLTALAPMVVITYCVLRGRPKRFVMIRKHNAVMGR